MLQMILTANLARALPPRTGTALRAIRVARAFDLTIGVLLDTFLRARRVIHAILLAILELVETLQLAHLLLLTTNARLH